MRWRLRDAAGRAELVVAVACLATAVALIFAAASSSESSGSLEQRAQAVAATLKCPVCHDLSAADSPAPAAQEMRSQIAADLRAGKTPDQIRAAFVASYGEWILLSPPKRELNLLPWLAPGLLGLAGLVLLAFGIRRWSGPGSSEEEGEGSQVPEPTDGDRRLVQEALVNMRSEIE
jgi:cytochrome c-type biogenesis protein CcmH